MSVKKTSNPDLDRRSEVQKLKGLKLDRMPEDGVVGNDGDDGPMVTAGDAGKGTFTKKWRPRFNNRYPWKKWFDKSPVTIRRNVHFDCNVKEMSDMARTIGRMKYGLRISAHCAGDDAVVLMVVGKVEGWVKPQAWAKKKPKGRKGRK